MELRALTRREANIFACIVQAAVAPGVEGIRVSETDAVEAFDRTLAMAPRLNRLGLRAMCYVLEVAPVLRHLGSRLRALSVSERDVFIASPGLGALTPLADALIALAQLSYYGDDGISRSLGYDPESNLARARDLRTAEGRW